MPQAILEFNLPEEKADFTWATKGYLYWRCLSELSEELRKIRKYGNLTEDQAQIIEQVEGFFYDTVGELLEEVDNG
jgi:hypothetical protein